MFSFLFTGWQLGHCHGCQGFSIHSFFRSRRAEDEGNIWKHDTLDWRLFFFHHISTSIQGEHGFRSWADVNQIRSKTSFDRNECMSLLAFHSLLDYIYIYIMICNDIMYSTYIYNILYSMTCVYRMVPATVHLH